MSKHTPSATSAAVQSVTGGGAAGQQGSLVGGGVQSTVTGDGIADNRDQGEQLPPKYHE